jgi:flagellar basal-body rod protein FlgC
LIAMSIFGAFNTAGSGLKVMRTWLDAVSDNIANLNDVTRTSDPAFAERFVHASAVDYGQAGQGSTDGGAKVDGVLFGATTGRLVYEPENPLADADGMVKYPDIDLGDQMSQLLVAQRGYQANLAVVDRVRDAYQQALNIGRNT